MKILVIGCGSIGQRHARNLSALPDVELSICDVSHEKVSALGEELSCPFYDDIGQALSEKHDGVIIALPNNLHHSIAKQALESGGHVLVEKPICVTVEEAKELVKLGEDRLFVVSNMRFHQAILALKEGLKHIGSPLFARAQFGNYLPNMRPNTDYRNLYVVKRSEGGGALMDCVHEIDYLSHLFGAPETVSATLEKLSDLELESEDYAQLSIKHENNFRSEIHLDYLQQVKQRGCEIIGTEGSVIWRSIGKNPEHCKVEYYSKQSGGWITVLDSSSLDHNACYVDLVKAFCAVIKGQHDNSLSTSGQAIIALATVHAAYKSSDEGRIVNLNEILE